MVDLSFAVDLVHGGRWTSLRAGAREWLWRRSADRSSVRPSDSFVDAGGLEECLPTVRGTPDHGYVWSRPWRAPGLVEGPDFALRRSVEVVGGAVVARYALAAAPGFRFVWAAHALLDLSPSALRGGAHRSRSPCGATCAAGRPKSRTGASAWSPCSAASSTSPRQAKATPRWCPRQACWNGT